MNEAAMRKHAQGTGRWNIFIFCVFAAVPAALMTAVCVFKYQHTYTRIKWDADRENRYQIVANMLERNHLIGMTEAEVIALLGGEDGSEQTTFKISREYFPPESTLVYYLGVDLIDNNWLVISLQNGVATDYRIDVT